MNPETPAPPPEAEPEVEPYTEGVQALAEKVAEVEADLHALDSHVRSFGDASKGGTARRLAVLEHAFERRLGVSLHEFEVELVEQGRLEAD